jgi:4-amino-4-deoxy-L-arabinose transferase-like glycosyltransferase
VNRRIGLVALGLAIGLLGELAFARPGRGALLVLALAAAALLVGLGAGLPAADDEPTPLPEAERPRRGARLVASLGSVLALVLVAIALRRFESGDAVAGWRYWIAALACLGGGFSMWGGTRTSRPSPSKRELAWLLVVLAAAAAFRFHHLTTEPYGVWFDEAQNALEAKKILEDPHYRPVFVSGVSQMPALSFYYFAAFVKLVGARVLAVRLGTTLVGLLAVVFVWLLGRELWSAEAGLLAGGFLAVSRWHVDFSRFGMAIVFPTLFIPAALFFFARSQRTRSPRDAVLGGIVLGLGMQTYYAMLAVPLLIVLSFAHGFVTKKSMRSAASAALLALLLLSTLLTYLPVLQYARAHELEFSERMRTVSAVHAGSMGELVKILVLPSPRRKEAWEVFGRNAAAHAAMFHVAGDRNGRHNLPGAPMLDRVTGLFFAIGLLFALALVREWRAATLLLWFFAMLAAGVLSLDFEAPQGARTCGLNSVIALLAALPLARIASLASGGAAPLRALAAVPVAAAGILSWRTYFGPQLHDPKVFAEFSSVETRIAEVVKAEGEGAALYAPLQLVEAPAQVLIVGHRIRATPFDRAADVPLQTSGRRAILFFRETGTDAIATLLRIYPHATAETLAATREDGTKARPVLYTVRVPAEDVAGLAGLEVRYTGPRGETAVGRAASALLDFTRAPLPRPFTAEARGTLHVASDGTYELRVGGDAPARLELDGETVAAGRDSRRLELARGNHLLRLVADVGKDAKETRLLLWDRAGGERPIDAGSLFPPVVSAAGLLGRYFRGDRCADGALAFRALDPQILFSFYGLGPSRPFAVCWSGSLYAPETGTYVFGTSSHKESAVSIDGRLVFDNPSISDVEEARVDLDAGWHALDVSFTGRDEYPYVELRWRTPHGGTEYVPSANLAPPRPSGGLLPREAPAPR